jgi:hypothetical protein
MASGEMNEGDFTNFLRAAFRCLAANSSDGAIHFVCMDWRHMWETLNAGRAIYSELKNLAVWNKTNGGMGTIYRSKDELVFVWKNGKAPHVNNFELGQHVRYRTNVWDYAGGNTMRAGRMEEVPCIRPLSRSPWWRTPSRIVHIARESSSTRFFTRGAFPVWRRDDDGPRRPRCLRMALSSSLVPPHGRPISSMN